MVMQQHRHRLLKPYPCDMNETEYERKEFQLASKREGELGAKRKTKSHVVCEIKVIRNEGERE